MGVHVSFQHLARSPVIRYGHHTGRTVYPKKIRKVPCSGALPDLYLHSKTGFLHRFIQGRTFVIRGDTGSNIFAQVLTRKPRCMTIDGFSGLFGFIDLCEYLPVAVDDSRIVHHLAKGDHVLYLEQSLHCIRPYTAPGGLEIRCRHAGRGGIIDIDGGISAILDHKSQSGYSQNICDLVRIAYH